MSHDDTRIQLVGLSRRSSPYSCDMKCCRRRDYRPSILLALACHCMMLAPAAQFSLLVDMPCTARCNKYRSNLFRANSHQVLTTLATLPSQCSTQYCLQRGVSTSLALQPQCACRQRNYLLGTNIHNSIRCASATNAAKLHAGAGRIQSSCCYNCCCGFRLSEQQVFLLCLLPLPLPLVELMPPLNNARQYLLGVCCKGHVKRPSSSQQRHNTPQH